MKICHCATVGTGRDGELLTARWSRAIVVAKYQEAIVEAKYQESIDMQEMSRLEMRHRWGGQRVAKQTNRAMTAPARKAWISCRKTEDLVLRIVVNGYKIKTFPRA